MTIETSTQAELHEALQAFFADIANGGGHSTVIVFPDGSTEDYEGIMSFLGVFNIGDFAGGAEEACRTYIEVFC